jgi:hypothetical protein
MQIITNVVLTLLLLNCFCLAQSGLATTGWVQGQGYSTGSGLPSGLITLVISGACPSGFTEVSALSGKFLQGTLAANGDVGTAGGNATITPTGTVSTPILTMNSYTPGGSVAAPTFTGTSSQSTSAVSAGTPAGTNATGTVTPAGTNAWPAGVPTNGAIAIGSFVNSATATTGNCAATNIAAGTGSTTACKATAPNLTVPAEGHSGSLTPPTISWPAGVPVFSGSSSTTSAEVFTGSALGTHSHTLTPAGTNSAPAFTGNSAVLTGSISQPTFTGSAVDPRPAFIKVIFCSAN